MPENEPVSVTPGEALLIQQVWMVAAARGWPMKKTIAKLKRVTKILQKAAESCGSGKPTNDKAVEAAERLLREIQKSPPDEGPASPPDATPPA